MQVFVRRHRTTMPSSRGAVKSVVVGTLQSTDAPCRKCLAEETAMQFVLVLIGASAAVFAALTTPRPERSESVLVRAVIDGDTIDVTTLGRVRLLGIDAPEIGRGFDTAAPFAYAARDKLAGLVLHRWVRLETDGERFDVYKRRLAYVVTDDGGCANVVMVREGLARVTARVPLLRLDELKQAEAEAQRFRKGMWGDAPPGYVPGYTRPKSPSNRKKKRRSSWPRSPSSTRRSARFASATSSITASITGRSGSSCSSSRPGRSRSTCSSTASIARWRSGSAR
jgi:endonuclease YncB( thermonuclease family)